MICSLHLDLSQIVPQFSETEMCVDSFLWKKHIIISKLHILFLPNSGILTTTDEFKVETHQILHIIATKLL